MKPLVTAIEHTKFHHNWTFKQLIKKNFIKTLKPYLWQNVASYNIRLCELFVNRSPQRL